MEKGDLNMIYKIGEVENSHISACGGKALNLNKLRQAAYLIPEGYIVTTEAFNEFMEYNNIDYNSDEYLAYNVEIQQEILKSKLQETFQKKLNAVFNDMKGRGVESFVIRSSAICEDSEEYSMAGMFESYVNLSTYEEIEEAVKKCYSSLFSERVLNFLFDNEISFDNLKMALVLQEYISGNVSGVMFTADTVQMDNNIVCISASKGECAVFVSGKAISEAYKVNKTTKEYKKESVQDSTETNILDETNIRSLLEMAISIESIMGYFQDIEWTIKDNNIYILQARSITTYKTKEFPIVWQNVEDEKSTWYKWESKALTPLMQDINDIDINSFSKGAERAVFRLDTYAEGKVVNGYYYVRNKELLDKDEKRKVFVEEVKGLFDEGKNIYEDLILPELLAIIRKIDECRKTKMNNKVAREYFKLALEYLETSEKNHWPAIHGNMYIDIFNEYIKNILTDINTEDYYDLIHQESILAKERRYIIEMSEMVKNNDVLADLFNECTYDEIIYQRLTKLEEGKELVEAIKKYQKEYEACDAGWGDVFHPVLGERPHYAIGSIKEMLQVDSKNFYDALYKTRENKKKIISQIEAKLTESEFAEFKYKLKLAEVSFLTNDNHNYYMERMYRGYARLAVNEVSKVLYDEKVISNIGDIYFLHINEIDELLINPSDMDSEICKRKELHKKQKSMLAPDIIGTMPPESIEDRKGDETTESKDNIVIKGVSGLCKKVTGKIICGLPNSIEEDSIILLPHCHYDGLMRVIGKVKGLIFNWGSPYDHMGIIARELGIPAIYNAKDAMKLLKNGDVVELDGINGEIRVL
jgi:pyruvate,water dikinase